MKFKVTSEQNDDIELGVVQLLDTLMYRVTEKPKPDHGILAKEFVTFLQAKQSLAFVNPAELTTMSFALGYLYRVFLEKNDVEILWEKDASDTDEHIYSDSSEESDQAFS